VSAKGWHATTTPLGQVIVMKLLILRPHHWLLCLVLALLETGAQAVPDRAPQEKTPTAALRVLKLGEPLDVTIAKGEVHLYQIALQKGQHVQITITQLSGHMNAAFRNPQEQDLAGSNCTLNLGDKLLVAIIEQSGLHQVYVSHAFKSEPDGRYRVEATIPEKITPEFLHRVTAHKLNRGFSELYGQQYTNPEPGLLQRIVEKAKELIPHWQGCGDLGWEMQTLWMLGDTYKDLGEYPLAVETMTRAIQLARQINLPFKVAESLITLGQTYVYMSDYPRALAAYEEALPLWEQNQDGTPPTMVAWNLTNIGSVQNLMGEKQKALASHQRAYQIYKDYPKSEDARQESERGMGLASNNIGAVYLSIGEKQKAMESHREAFAHFKASRDVVIMPFALNRLGEAYLLLGEPRTALDYFQQALAQMRKNDEPQAQAGALHNIGRAQVMLSEYAQATENISQALTIRRKIGDRRGQALSLTSLGSIQTLQEQHQRALLQYQEALQLWRAIGDRYGEAYCLNYLGLTHYALRERPKAKEYFEQALALRRAVLDREGEANTLYNLARIACDEQQLTSARHYLETALALTESLRTSVLSQELRASYLATVRDYYELYIELLMQLHEREPAKGFAAQALQAAEKARARSMLDTLAEAGNDLHEGVPAALLTQERDLQQRLNAKAEYQTRLQIGNAKTELLQSVAREIQTLTAEAQEVRSRIRATSPRYAALTQPQPLSAAEIQTLLDKDTLLLEYALGEERSWLWVVSPTTIKTFALPKRADIEATARRFYQLLTARNQSLPTETTAQRRLRVQQSDSEFSQTATALSRMILAPATAELGQKRLLVVAPGALQYVPFAALPEPKAEGGRQKAGREKIHPSSLIPHPLIVRHELAAVPSASVLALLRREERARALTPKTIAVLADPVFSATDDRVQTTHPRTASQIVTSEMPSPTTPPSPLLRAIADLQGDGNDAPVRIARLSGTRWEAEKIAALVPAKQKLVALDFNANRTLALSGELSQYRILHFASHAFINTIHPELSGIVLSLVDKEGNAQDGFLRANEIYNLKLPAELVVLSACQTGLGRDVKGEGLIGLTQSFMYAGAPRLIVSLWALQDKATADLMARFYQHLLGPQKLSPAAALRAAQVEMWQTKRWPSPYFWAGFVLQGEWK
jgi:CHAT domain-containing protein